MWLGKVWCRALAVALVLTGMASSRAAAAMDVVTLRADSWCPYNCEPETEQPGILVEIATEAFRRRGMTTDYKLMPWPRTLEEVRTGRIDGAVGAGPGEGPNLFFGRTLLGASEVVMARRRGSRAVYDGIESLSNQRIAALRGYAYDYGALDAFFVANERNTKGNVTLLSGDEVTKQLIRLLLSGRVDLIVETRAVLKFHARRIDGGENVEIIRSIYVSPAGIGFSDTERGRRLAAILDEEVENMRADGRLGAILARYGLSPSDFEMPAAR